MITHVKNASENETPNKKYFAVLKELQRRLSNSNKFLAICLTLSILGNTLIYFFKQNLEIFFIFNLLFLVAAVLVYFAFFHVPIMSQVDILAMNIKMGVIKKEVFKDIFRSLNSGIPDERKLQSLIRRIIKKTI